MSASTLVVFRLCRCGRMHAKVPCEESEAREEKRAVFQALLDAKKSAKTKKR